MIRSLSNITDISVLDQNEKDNILSFNKIEFDDYVLGSGGFAKVYTVVSVDGIQKTEFVVKILTEERFNQHNYDSIKLLHDKLKKRQLKTGTPIFHDLPELLGLPFIVFKGYDEISEKRCVAFLMYNLVKLNYEDYSSNSAKLKEYKALNISDKIYLAYQLTKTIEFLHQIKFIHSDFAEDSIFLNSKRIQLALIDYDSGYHFDTQDKPSTIGKLSHWARKGFRNIFGQAKDSGDVTTLDRLYKEYWILANANFEVIFGAMPFFFLSDSEDITKEKYLNNFDWPNIDYSSSLFNKANIQQHLEIISIINEMEKSGASDLINAFKVVFNKGFKSETKRLTSKQWKDILFDINQLLDNIPLNKRFKSNKANIKRKNEEVIFSFDIQKYNAIYLNKKLISLNQNQVAIPIQDNCKVFLRVVNDFEVVEDSIEIKAIKTNPKIIMFGASELLRDSSSPIELKWEVENAQYVSISNIKKSFPINHKILVEPKSKTNYILTAHGYFNQEFTEELVIDVISPTIKSFDWKINLDKGIDNVDLSWVTEDANSVVISPRIGEQPSNGIYHIGIAEKTVFVLTAIGLFSETKIDLEAVPFPIPLIEKLLVTEPIIESNIDVNITISDIITRIPITPSIDVNETLFVIQKLPSIEEPKFLSAKFEILQKTKPHNFDKLMSKLKYKKKYEIKNQ